MQHRELIRKSFWLKREELSKQLKALNKEIYNVKEVIYADSNYDELVASGKFRLSAAIVKKYLDLALKIIDEKYYLSLKTPISWTYFFELRNTKVRITREEMRKYYERRKQIRINQAKEYKDEYRIEVLNYLSISDMDDLDYYGLPRNYLKMFIAYSKTKENDENDEFDKFNYTLNHPNLSCYNDWEGGRGRNRDE